MPQAFVPKAKAKNIIASVKPLDCSAASRYSSTKQECGRTRLSN
jgi:hypothetical protein